MNKHAKLIPYIRWNVHSIRSVVKFRSLYCFAKKKTAWKNNYSIYK